MEEFEKVRSFIKLGTEDIKVQVHVEKDCQSMGDRETLKNGRESRCWKKCESSDEKENRRERLIERMKEERVNRKDGASEKTDKDLIE